jgi:hypothetical protein
MSNLGKMRKLSRSAVLAWRPVVMRLLCSWYAAAKLFRRCELTQNDVTSIWRMAYCHENTLQLVCKLVCSFLCRLLCSCYAAKGWVTHACMHNKSSPGETTKRRQLVETAQGLSEPDHQYTRAPSGKIRKAPALQVPKGGERRESIPSAQALSARTCGNWANSFKVSRLRPSAR